MVNLEPLDDAHPEVVEHDISNSDQIVEQSQSLIGLRYVCTSRPRLPQQVGAIEIWSVYKTCGLLNYRNIKL